MKISSASKKVLASALSAAMVVAFAPTLAFATPSPDATKTVDVTYDANGGTISDGVSGETVALQKDSSNGKYYVAVNGTTEARSTSGYEQDSTNKWFIDADGDGLLSKGEVKSSGGYIEVPEGTTAITLKANYVLPTVAVGTYATGTYTGGGSVVSDASAKKLPVTVDGTKMVASGHTYVVKVTCPDGTSSEVATYGAGATPAPSQATDIDVWFSKDAVSTDKTAFLAEHLTSGEYTVELSDNGKVISTAKTELAKVTVTAGDEAASSLFQLNSDGKATVPLTDVKELGDYVAYLDADGYNAGTSVEITGDASFTATKDAQAAGAVTYVEAVDGVSGKPTGKAGTLSFTIESVANATKYDVAVADPSGATVYSASYDTAGANTVSFDTTAGGARMSASEQAGTYVVTVTASGKNAGKDFSATSKSKVVLTQVKYDAGEHASFAKSAVTSYFTDEAATDTIAFNAPAPDVADGYVADYATLNGAKASDKGYKVKAGEANTYAFVQKALSYADAPAWSVEKKTAGTATQYVLTVTPAAGTTVKVDKYVSSADEQLDSALAEAKTYILASDVTKVELVASATAGSKTQKTVTLENVSGAAKTWAGMTSGASSKLELKVGNSATKWLAVDGVASAIASGKTAFEALAAKSFATSDDSAAVAKDAAKALYEAVAAEADAQLAAYKDAARVVVGDKVYKMDAKTYDAQAKKLAEAEKAVSDVKEATADTYTNGVNSVITAANAALAAATEDTSVKAADITAAAAVTEQLKAAKDATTAKAAIEAYNKLTDAQKALVATADVTAAQAIVTEQEKKDAEAKAAEEAKKAAEELVKAQDKAAVAGITGKTVKAKAKKKVTAKLAGATSESGAVVTFSKKSGNAKVKVGAAGKITVKKGLKKGKKYTVKVTASCGAATKVVKVVVKVVK